MQWQFPMNLQPNMFLSGSRHCAAAFFVQIKKKHRDLDHVTLLYILILGTYSKFVLKKNMLALGVCFPLVFCLSAVMLERWPQD